MNALNIKLSDCKIFMKRAITLAKKGLYTTNPNPRVGCVIVVNNQIVGEGFHKKTGQPHAEVHALKQAGALANNADVYVTLEPCSHFGQTPPCAKALIKAKVKRVFIASLDPNPLVSGKGIKLLEDAGIVVYSGLLYKKAAELNVGFFKRMQTGLPWVRVKMAMSLDARTAMASGESKWITGAEARQDVQKLRARSSAILTSISTIKADNPSMNVRLKNKASYVKAPLLVVLDSNGQLTGNEKLFSVNKHILIYSKKVNSALEPLKSDVEICIDKSEGELINLKFVLFDLGKRQINELHVECGNTLAGALIYNDLADELVTYIAPKLMGSAAMALLNLNLDKMSQTKKMLFKEVKSIGQDIKITSIFK